MSVYISKKTLVELVKQEVENELCRMISSLLKECQSEEDFKSLFLEAKNADKKELDRLVKVVTLAFPQYQKTMKLLLTFS